MPSRQPVVEHIKDKANPEVLLNVAGRHIKTDRGCHEGIPLLPHREREKGLVSLTHATTGQPVVMLRVSGKPNR